MSRVVIDRRTGTWQLTQITKEINITKKMEIFKIITNCISYLQDIAKLTERVKRIGNENTKKKYTLQPTINRRVWHKLFVKIK